MAKGSNVGDQVRTKILGASWVTHEFGNQASKVEMLCEVVRKERTDPATKWLIRWDKRYSGRA